MRPLRHDEIVELVRMGNRAENWDLVSVSDSFCPALVRDCFFQGHVAIGALCEGSCPSPAADLPYPEGLSRSWIADCSIGDHCAVHGVRRMVECTIGSHVTIADVGEMSPSDGAKPIAVMNENGGRSVVPFPGMRICDAFLWAKWRGSGRLQEALAAMTKSVAPCTVGDNAYIVGCMRLHGVSLLSDAASPTAVLDAIALEHGVVGYGCRVERGCILHGFLLGENVHLEDGARINDSVIGDNSTVARCEVGSSLVYPSHEQHHNNSFLIAACLHGQSNVAAGSTIGSNHNGRTADGELVAARGFWPGLCTSFKHSSAFAPYCLVAKGDYPHELDISLPFSLVSNNVAADRLEVIPAFWWLYNMYALRRNESKFADRDRRRRREQHIVYDVLAPDTAEAILCGRHLLRQWTEMAYLRQRDGDGAVVVRADAMERGRRQVVILKAAQGFEAYEEMLYYYIGRELSMSPYGGDGAVPCADGVDFRAGRESVWENMGGQLVRRRDLDAMVRDIESGILSSWDDVHRRFDDLWDDYPRQRYEHAYLLLCRLCGVSRVDEEVWEKARRRYEAAERTVMQRASACRQKDLADPFRRMTFADGDEQRAVLGDAL